MHQGTQAEGSVAYAQVGEIELAYETFGHRRDPPMVLIMGLATQMLGWPDGFCTALADAGHFVVRFDNRDVGLSTHLDDFERGRIGTLLAGGDAPVAYTLDDMAADVVGLLDALELDAVHLVGASMGGMIAQLVALDHPGRVLSLTSMLSSTGDRAVGQPSEAAVAVLLARTARSRREAVRRTLDTYRVIGGKGFEFEHDGIADRAGRMYDRSYDPAGMGRQFAAVLVADDRTARLRRLRVPTLVIHGTDDELVDPSGGDATARAIRDAELMMVEGMGHDLPVPMWPELVARIGALVERAEARA